MLTLVEELLTTNPDLLARLRSSEYTRSTAESVAELANDGASTIIPADIHDPTHGESISFPIPVDSENGSLSNGAMSAAFTIDIELSLQASWVYRRAQRQRVRPTVAFDSQTIGLSFLSGISLSEISNLAVIALPISIDDIPNNQHYMTTPPASFVFPFGDDPVAVDNPEDWHLRVWTTCESPHPTLEIAESLPNDYTTGHNVPSHPELDEKDDRISPRHDIFNENSLDKKSSGRKGLLGAALSAASQAVVLDQLAFNSSGIDVDQSIMKYEEAIGLLRKVRDQTRDPDDKIRLSRIYGTYADRIELLRKKESDSRLALLLSETAVLAVLASPTIGFEDDDTFSESELEVEAAMKMAKVE